MKMKLWLARCLIFGESKNAMIDDNLDAYTCGIDNIMELGYSQNIVAPSRLSFRDMLDVDPANTCS